MKNFAKNMKNAGSYSLKLVSAPILFPVAGAAMIFFFSLAMFLDYKSKH